MLKGLTHNNGLSAGPKEIEMIEHARLKRELETNMLPFTDEACFHIRKRMMETQELREYKLREAEMEAQRDVRLATLARTLEEREESNEFLASQRVEAIRQSRMDVREKTLKKIRKKRIDILRKLARKRNTTDSLISGTKSRDVINDYFDRSSDVYAPLKREGKVNPTESRAFDTTVRAAPLHIVDNVEVLEATIPKVFTQTSLKPPALGGDQPILLSKTAPIGGKGGGRAAEARLTSAAYRSIRNTKRDIETMHMILTKNRTSRAGDFQQSQDDVGVGSGPQTVTGGENISTFAPAASLDGSQNIKQPSLLNKKPKGRPRTPDITAVDRTESDNLPLYAAVALLQRLIRGRATQNSMFEGRYRRSELIAELRAADDYERTIRENPEESQYLAETKWSDNMKKIKETSVDCAAGAVSSNLLVLLAAEKEREEVFREMQEEASRAVLERRQRELKEAGRRQKEEVPNLVEVPVAETKTTPPPVTVNPTATTEEKVEEKSVTESSPPPSVMEPTSTSEEKEEEKLEEKVEEKVEEKSVTESAPPPSVMEPTSTSEEKEEEKSEEKVEEKVDEKSVSESTPPPSVMEPTSTSEENEEEKSEEKVEEKTDEPSTE
jgi:hypothetical protein